MHSGNLNFQSLSLNQFSNWTVPFIAFLFYVTAFIAGYYLSLPILNVIGAFLFLFILLMGNFEKMFSIKFDITVLTALFILLISTISSAVNIENIAFRYLAKHYFIFITYIFIFSYKFIPLYESRKRNYFIAVASIILYLSLISDITFETQEEVRFTGIFVNPNNLSLVSLALLYFINEKKDSIYTKSALNLVVMYFLFISSTAGAIIAYITATIFKYRAGIPYKKYLLIGLLLMAVLSFLILPSVEIDRFLPAKKIINHYMAIKEYLSEGLLHEQEVSYYKITSQYGFSSGVWRLEQWKKTIHVIKDSDALRLLFGHGIGSASLLVSNLPHNEYLRVLLEQGIIGFVSILFFFITIYRRIDCSYRYLILMFAIFSFSENNLNNSMFMILFIMFIATAQVTKINERGD
jgi:O-antigen ligase